MKKIIRINFKYFWEGFDPKDNFFTNLLRKRYNVVISDNPDYLFYSVYPDNGPKNIAGLGKFIKFISPLIYRTLRKLFAKGYYFFNKPKPINGKFIKIFYGSEHIKPRMDECDWAFGSHFEDEVKSSKYMRIPMYAMANYKLKNFGMPSFRKKIDINKIIKEKTKFCNFIYSQDIPFRNDFFKKLNTYKMVDAPGRCMNNMNAIGSDDPGKSRKSDNWVNEKLNFLKRYKFTIAFENFSSSGWVTEKLTHPMIVNSLPIYFGHEDIKKEFNTKSFINYNDFKNMDDFIQHIIKVDNDDKMYINYLEQPFYVNPKNMITEEKILKQFKRIFG